MQEMRNTSLQSRLAELQSAISDLMYCTQVNAAKTQAVTSSLVLSSVKEKDSFTDRLKL